MKLSSLLGAVTAGAGVLAVPGKPPGNPGGSRYLRRDVTGPWAGAVQEGSGWNFVTGTFTVPDISGQDPSAGVAVWVGIDGLSCQSAIWQTGLTFTGDGSIYNWYEWWPNPPVYGSRFSASPGDRVRMTVHAHSTTSGNSSLENLSTGQKVTEEIRGQQYPLCLQDAEWILEDFDQVPLVDFGTVAITDARAAGPYGAANPAGAQIVNIVSDDRQRTSCGSDASGMSCDYVP